MNDLKDLLFALSGAVGTPGSEEEVAKIALPYLQNTGTAHTDSMGNVLAFFGDEASKTQLLLDAHLDQIGLVVTHIDQKGFLHIAPCGGVDRRALLGNRVTVYGKTPVLGIISCMPPHLMTGDENKIPPVDEMTIDIGMTKEEAEKVITLGDRAVIKTEPKSLLGTKVTGGALDNRAGIASVIRCAQLLQNTPLNCGVTILLSSREETGSQGAKTAAYEVEPTQCIVVDVSFASQPGVAVTDCGKLGKGPMIGVGSVLSKPMKEKLIAVANEYEIPYQIEVMAGQTGTNADPIGVTKKGIEVITLSIPLRYMHTPVEVVDLKDIEAVAQLLAGYMKQL